jgi:hypothetical protein
VIERVVARIQRRIASVVEIALRGDPKRPDGGEHAAVLAIEFVQVLAVVLYQFPLQTTWQIEAVHERIARVVAITIVAVTFVSPAFVLAGVVIVTRIEIHRTPPTEEAVVTEPGSMDRGEEGGRATGAMCPRVARPEGAGASFALSGRRRVAPGR